MRNLAILPLVGIGLTGVLVLGSAGGSTTALAPASAKARTTVYRQNIQLARVHVWDHHQTHPYSLSESYSSGRTGPRAIRSIHQASTEIPGNRVMTTATMRLQGGEIVFGGSTANMDEATYAIVGGTGRFTGAGGSVSLHGLNRSTVRVTVKVRQ